MVIDYNTANAPGGVRQGAGSAFFLHVAVGAPTEGCVAIDAASSSGSCGGCGPPSTRASSSGRRSDVGRAEQRGGVAIGGDMDGRHGDVIGSLAEPGLEQIP